MISPGHGRALLVIEDPEKQYQFAQKIFDEKMSVRDVEKEVKRLQKNKKEDKKKDQKPDERVLTELARIEEELKQKIGTKVRIQPKNAESGKIEIEYFSGEELDKILNYFNK